MNTITQTTEFCENKQRWLNCVGYYTALSVMMELLETETTIQGL